MAKQPQPTSSSQEKETAILELRAKNELRVKVITDTFPPGPERNTALLEFRKKAASEVSALVLGGEISQNQDQSKRAASQWPSPLDDDGEYNRIQEYYRGLQRRRNEAPGEYIFGEFDVEQPGPPK